MIINLKPRRRILTVFSTLLIFAVYFQALPIPLASQGFISRLATKRASNVKASFHYAPLTPVEGQAVQFMDTSTGGPTSWQWDFGDGTTSTDQNPGHAYVKAGFKKITLTASNSSSTRQTTRTMTVIPAAKPASFVFSPISPTAGQDVQFADTTSGGPTSWQWDFGDGATSTAKNPSHAFPSPSSYLVTLIASNNSGSKRGSQTISVASVSSLAASFAYSPSSPATGQSVQFTDTSTGTPTSWQWNFGDGGTSTSQSPAHAFTTTGAKTVTLTATNASGSNSTTQTVTVVAALAASFSYSPASPAAGQTVQFTDASVGTPTSWQWNFGDGGTSTAQNPSHAFTTAGSKTVTLIATNSSGSNTATRTITVTPALNAAFTYSPASPIAGQAVQFTDTSVGTPTSWQWNFGDGATSVANNPSHTFASAGSYNVTLTIMNASGQNTVNQSITVAPVNTLAASFTYSPASPAAGQAVQFTDTSAGTPTSWSWAFGDGGTSTNQSPSHVFTTTGAKTVTLTATNASGSNSTTRTVTVVAALAASFTYSPASPAAGQTVQFTDTSVGTPTSWQWNFNDGSTSTLQNPSHTFTTAGMYNVTLTGSNVSGSNTASNVITVTSAATLTASFTFSPSSPTAGQSVQFTDTSAGTPTSWQWSFGDGATSSAQNPGHTYATVGSYTVSLIVANNSGTNSGDRPITVVSASAIIINHNSANLASIPAQWILAAKQTLHIAFGHTSDGMQLTAGMTGLVAWSGGGSQYSYNWGGTGGALDLRDYNAPGTPMGAGSTFAHDLGADDNGNLSYTAWEAATRAYLATNPGVNVVMWAWCWQMNSTDVNINTYLSLMNGLERDYPNIKFIYMTGRTVGGQWGPGSDWAHNHYMRAKQIRDYCIANNKILFDFADIESWDPDGIWHGDKLCNTEGYWDKNGDGTVDYDESSGGLNSTNPTIRSANWMLTWMDAHPNLWYACTNPPPPHTNALNANLKAYAAWALFARLAGWDGRTN